MRRVHYHLTDDQLEWLRRRSEETGLTVAELIRRAIDVYIDQIEEQGTDAPRRRGRS